MPVGPLAPLCAPSQIPVLLMIGVPLSARMRLVPSIFASRLESYPEIVSALRAKTEDGSIREDCISQLLSLLLKIET
jgi:hypothetical protein